MFKDWGFLITEMMGLIILAALLGLVVGWIVWGRRKPAVDSGAADRLDGELEACRRAGAEAQARIAALESDLASTGAELDEARRHRAVAAPAQAAVVAAAATTEAARPAALAGPREGGPDDLRQIKGVGPKLEALCHQLGFYHFDQIAGWSAAEVAWVDENLEGFKGRVSRDGWVEQAKVLAAGGSTEFSDRVKGGEVY